MPDPLGFGNYFTNFEVTQFSIQRILGYKQFSVDKKTIPLDHEMNVFK